MTSPETPEKDENDSQPETVEAEIVDDVSEAEASAAPHVEAEMVSDTEDVSVEAKKPNLVTPGMILMGIMAFALVIVFLNQGTADRAASTAEEVVVAEGETGQADLLANDVDATAEKVENTTAASLSEAREQIREEVAPVRSTASDEPEAEATISDELPETPAGPSDLATDDPNEQRRLDAIERARQRREARTASPEVGQETAENTAAPLVETEPGTSDESPVLAGSETPMQGDTSPAIAETGDAEAVQAANASPVVVADPALATQLEVIKDDVKADVLAEVAADKRRLARQEEEIDQLRQELDTALAEQDRRAEQLEARLNSLQTRDVATATKQAALSLAVTNLQRQMSSGRPFGEQLDVLEQLAPGTAGIRALKPYASTGLPTLGALQSSYSDAARKALAAAKRSTASGPLEEVGARFAGLFSIRKSGMVEGDNPSAIISRAEVSLDDGDLYTCLKELGELDGEAAEAMTSWMSDARSLVTADQLLDELSNKILATL